MTRETSGGALIGHSKPEDESIRSETSCAAGKDKVNDEPLDTPGVDRSSDKICVHDLKTTPDTVIFASPSTGS
jgi:hypothetical protein